jgi:hypothetical protein
VKNFAKSGTIRTSSHRTSIQPRRLPQSRTRFAETPRRQEFRNGTCFARPAPHWYARCKQRGFGGLTGGGSGSDTKHRWFGDVPR